jgi:hypothetical protein
VGRMSDQREQNSSPGGWRKGRFITLGCQNPGSFQTWHQLRSSRLQGFYASECGSKQAGRTKADVAVSLSLGHYSIPHWHLCETGAQPGEGACLQIFPLGFFISANVFPPWPKRVWIVRKGCLTSNNGRCCLACACPLVPREKEFVLMCKHNHSGSHVLHTFF